MSNNQVKRRVEAEIATEKWRLDNLRRVAESDALRAVHEQQRPAYEALHVRCGEVTGHNMTTTGYTVGGLAYGNCVWCGKYWREEREVEI